MTTAVSSPETAVNNGRGTTCIPCGTAVGMTTSPRCASQGWDGCSPPWNSQCKELDFAIWLPGIPATARRSRAGSTASKGGCGTSSRPSARSARAPCCRWQKKGRCRPRNVPDGDRRIEGLGDGRGNGLRPVGAVESPLPEFHDPLSIPAAPHGSSGGPVNVNREVLRGPQRERIEMVAGFQPGENQNPLPRAVGRFDHHPPLAAPGGPAPGAAFRSTSALVEPAVGAAMAALAARTPTPASANRPTTPSTGTSTRYAAAAATESSGASTTTTPPPWSRMDPRVEPKLTR